MFRVLSLFLFFVWGLGNAQGIRIEGRVYDELHQPLGFVNVFVQGTLNGTVSNENGWFFIEVESFNHILEFRYLGYQTHLHPLQPNDSVQALSIQLKPGVSVLQEALIDGNRNPALEIMRQVIRNKAKFNIESTPFECDVYIKGLQEASDLPEKILGREINREELGLDSTGSGIVYFFESINKLEFKPPNQYQETILSSKVSGNNQAFSYLQASDLIMNFNQSLVPCVDMDRGIVSPLANNAFFFYQYRLEGSFYEGDQKFYRIRFSPKRKTDPAGTGILIIKDDLWYVQTLQLTLYRKNQLNTLDSLVIQNEYQYTNQVYLPAGSMYQFGLNIYGIGAHGYFMTRYLKYNLEKKRETIKRPKTEVLRVIDSANQRSPEYWEAIRPVPLTPLEIGDYRTKDSLELVEKQDEKKTHTDFGWHWLISSVSHRNPAKNLRLESRSIFKSINYNTVEGLVFEPQLSLRIRHPQSYQTKIEAVATARYGFSNQLLQGSLEGEYQFKSKWKPRVRLEMGSSTTPIGGNRTMTETMNSLTTLFYGYNYLKFFKRDWLTLGYGMQLFNGGIIFGSLSYEMRTPMENAVSYSFQGQRSHINSNQLVDFYPYQALFEMHRALLFDITFKIKPFNKYIKNGDHIINLGSNWPDIELAYKQIIQGVHPTEPDYSRLELRGYYNLNLKLLGENKLAIAAGQFLNAKRVHFPDYFIPGSNPGFYQPSNLRSLRLQTIQPYHPSTTDGYFQFHSQHYFNKFLLNKIPLLRRLRANEFVGFQMYAYTAHQPITEYSIGLDRLALFKKDIGLFRIEGIHGRSAGLNNYVLRVGMIF